MHSNDFFWVFVTEAIRFKKFTEVSNVHENVDFHTEKRNRLEHTIFLCSKRSKTIDRNDSKA
jgi:hypothetical protein